MTDDEYDRLFDIQAKVTVESLDANELQGLLETISTLEFMRANGTYTEEKWEVYCQRLEARLYPED